MVVAIAYLMGQQTPQIENLPYKPTEMFFAGEREVITGMLPYRDTVMPMYHTKETYPQKPNNVYGGPNWQEYSLGALRWSVRPDTFATKPCMVLHADGLYTPEKTFEFNRFRKVTVSTPLRGTIEWWVDLDGTILRQTQVVQDTRGVRRATCTYAKDSINVETDDFGKRSVSTVYPGDMALLQAQFLPMVARGRILRTEKTYVAFDPFNGSFVKHTARVRGHFDGMYLGLKFHGVHVDLDNVVPEGPIKVYVSDENDLVQIDLPNDRYVTLGAPPPGREAAHN